MDADLSFLGLLNRGGKLRIGEDALRSRHPALLLLASDASANSRKKYLDFAASRKVRVCENHTKIELGSAIGYEELSCILLEDQKAAKAYLAKLSQK